MEAELKAKMDDDLKRKLDNLFRIKMQPSLALSERFDDIISQVDYDAEKILYDLQTEQPPSASGLQESEKVNGSRVELVRILKVLERSIRSQLLPNQSKELDRAVEAIEKRTHVFLKTTVSPEADINDLDDSYEQLIVEITEMANAEESKLFGNQSIFYLRSANKREFGSLYHLTDVFLTKDQIGCLE